MRSLRRTLIAWATLGATAILVVAGIAVYVLLRASLVQQCDRQLLQKARFLAALTTQSPSGHVDLKFDDFQPSQVGATEESTHLQVWLDGTTVFRSPPLRDMNLEPLAGPMETPVHRWVDLPDGQTGRAIGITFMPTAKNVRKSGPAKNGKAGDLVERDSKGQLSTQGGSSGDSIASRSAKKASAKPGSGYLTAEDVELAISEFMAANNTTLRDQDGDFSDWIEICNLTDHVVNLEGWYLTDKLGIAQWPFPKVSIGARDHLLVIASGKDRRNPSSELHTSFRLDADGECLALLRPDGRTIESAYAPEYPHQVADISYGLALQSLKPGYFLQPTPGLPNDASHTEERPTPASRPITLVLARDTQSIDETLVRLGRLLLSVGAVAIPTLASVLWLVVRRNLGSLDLLARQIGQLRESDLSTRIKLAGCPRELKPVIDRLNRLLQQLDAAFQHEREFSAGLAHELRTPLAGLRLKTDVALSKSRQSHEYQQAIADCREIAAQMETMTENLLSLARLEAGRVKTMPERVVPNEIITESWKVLSELAEKRRLRVEWKLGLDSPVITDPTHLAMVIRNLLDNAVRYADEGGLVRIETAEVNGDAVFRIANSGSTLPQNRVEKVFERFWRGDSARSDAAIHCGIGLSLTRKAVTILGGLIQVQSTAGGDFEVTVSIPIGRAHPALV